MFKIHLTMFTLILHSLQLNVYRRHPTTPDATPSAGSPSPTSPPRSARSRDYGAVPTVEENLETGGPAQRAAADFSERLVRPRAVSDASSGSTRPPSLLHERIAGDSGLRLQEPDLDLQRASTDASDSTLNVYDAAADAPTARLPLAQPISAANMHVIAFAGMRGAVSFSLAYIFPDTHGNRSVLWLTSSGGRKILCSVFTSSDVVVYFFSSAPHQGPGSVHGDCGGAVYKLLPRMLDRAAHPLAEHHHGCGHR